MLGLDERPALIEDRADDHPQREHVAEYAAYRLRLRFGGCVAPQHATGDKSRTPHETRPKHNIECHLLHTQWVSGNNGWV